MFSCLVATASECSVSTLSLLTHFPEFLKGKMQNLLSTGLAGSRMGTRKIRGYWSSPSTDSPGISPPVHCINFSQMSSQCSSSAHLNPTHWINVGCDLKEKSVVQFVRFNHKCISWQENSSYQTSLTDKEQKACNSNRHISHFALL